MDTEHGFAGKLKAIRVGILKIFRDGSIGGKSSAGLEAEHGAGENGSQFAEAFIGDQHGIIMSSHADNSGNERTAILGG